MVEMKVCVEQCHNFEVIAAYVIFYPDPFVGTKTTAVDYYSFVRCVGYYEAVFLNGVDYELFNGYHGVTCC
jgi:hypothetical protein